MSKRKLSLGIASVMLVGTTLSMASPLDISHQTDVSQKYEFTDFLNDGKIFDLVGRNMEKYIIEAFDGKLYSAKEVNDALEVDSTLDFSDVVKTLTPVGEDPTDEDHIDTDFKVISIE